MNEEIDVKVLLGPIRRRYRLILSIVFSIVLFAGLIGISITPKFQASTLVYVDTTQAGLLDDNVNFSNSSADNSRVTSEVEIVKSDGVILKLVDRLNLIQDKEFGAQLSRIDKLLTVLGLEAGASPGANSAIAPIISRVKNAVSVQRRGLTYIISISATSEDPEKSATLANELASSYIENQLSSKIQNIRVSLAAVERQISETEVAVITTQQTLNDFITNNLDEIAKANSEVDLVQLQSQLIQLQQQKDIELTKRAAILDGLSRASGGVALGDLEVQALRELEQQRQTLTSQLSGDQLGSISVDELRRQLGEIETKIQEETDTIVSRIDQRVNLTDNSISEFQNQLNSKVLGGDIVLPDEIGAQLFRLSQQSRNTNSQYQTLLAKGQELEAESLLQIAESRVISPAIAPTSAVSPNLKLIIAAALIFGIGLGIGVAFLVENFVGGIVDVEQVEALTGTQLATSIRKLTKPNADERSYSDRIVTEPLSYFSESMRRLRTSIQIVLSKREREDDSSKDNKLGTVIMVSSSVPSEGKSTISISLARTLAFSGAKTLIIDCDIRKPSISSHLKEAQHRGLANLFKGTVNSQTLIDNVVLDDLTNLHAVLSDRNSMRDTQFTLGFRPFDRIIEKASRQYDYVILDTPPVGPVADALTLANSSDIILFVVRWASTSQKLVRENVNLFSEMAPDKPILAVLNQVEGDSGTPYQQYSGYYSDS